MPYYKYVVSLCGEVAIWREQIVEVQCTSEPGVFIAGSGWLVSKEYGEHHVEHDGSNWMCSFVSKDRVDNWKDILTDKLSAALDDYKEIVVAEVQSSKAALATHKEYIDGGWVSKI